MERPGLGATARLDRLFDAQLIQRVGREPAAVADRRIQRGARGAVADREVAELVHRGATHPAVGRVRRVARRLGEGEYTARGGAAELVPARARGAAALYRVRDHG